MSTMAIEFKDMCRAMNFSAVDVVVSTIEKIRMCIDKMNRYVEYKKRKVGNKRIEIRRKFEHNPPRSSHILPCSYPPYSSFSSYFLCHSLPVHAIHMHIHVRSI